MTDLGSTPRVIAADPGVQVQQQPCCSTCGSHDPLLHPAIQADYDGSPYADEADDDGTYVVECPDDFHVDHLGGQPFITIRPAGGVL